MGSLSWEKVLHELLQHESFPQAAVLHGMLQCGSLPWGAVFRNRLLQRGSPTGSQVLPLNQLQRGFFSPQGHRSCQERRLPTVSQPPLGASTCSRMESSMGWRWIAAPLLTSMGCWGTACLTMVVSTGFRGISAQAPGAPLSHRSSLTLVSAELFLSHLLTPLSLTAFAPGGLVLFPPFLNKLSQRCYHHGSLSQPWPRAR